MKQENPTKGETKACQSIPMLCGELTGTVILKVLLWPILIAAHVKLKFMPGMNRTAEHAYDATGLLANGAWFYFLCVTIPAGIGV